MKNKKWILRIPAREKMDFRPGCILLCPLCKFDYNHVISAEKINGNDNYEAWREGRGNLGRIKFNCESGHYYSLNFGEHKGNMYIYWEENPEDAPNPDQT